MSTASYFQFRDGFIPRNTNAVLAAPYDYVDVTIADAMQLFWLLEGLEFVTTCTAGAADINWTTTIGPTESLPFTANSNSKSGPYYDASFIAPFNASQPNERAAVNQTGVLLSLNASRSFPNNQILIQLFVRDISTVGYLRVYYLLEISSITGGRTAAIFNPSNSAYTGTPPSSGSISIVGIPFSWVGGGATSSAWDTEPATFSATSSVFTI